MPTMSPKPCDVCASPLTNADADWWVCCRSCEGLHFFCLTCVLLWGRQLGLPDRPRRNVWAEVEVCPDEARATAELMGFDLGMLSPILRAMRERKWDNLGSGLADAAFGKDWPPMARGVA